jgi:hypothetical protein
VSWYNPASGTWPYRLLVSVDFSAWSSGSNDITITIPVGLDIFWTTVLASGYDVLFTESDGVTKLTSKRTSWTYASKVGVFEIDAVTPTKVCIKSLWMYWGNASATDQSGAPTIGSPINGYLHAFGPTAPLIRVVPDRTGALLPSQSFSMSDEETRNVYVDWDAVLARRCARSARSDYGDEIKEVSADIRKDDDSAVGPTPIVLASSRIVSCSRGRGSIVLYQIDGTKMADNDDRTLAASILTSEGLILTTRIGLYVRNVRAR